MPRVNIYIREDDWQKFQAIEDRPLWLSHALRNTDVPKVNKAITERKEIEKVMKPFMKHMARNTVGFCPNSHPIPEGREKCLGKGCKYS